MDKSIFITGECEVFEVLMKKVPVCCPSCDKPFIASAELVIPEQAICPHCKKFIRIEYVQTKS